MSITIGIIGTGAIARTHASILAKLDDIVIGPVFDQKPRAAERFAEDFSARVLPSASSVIEAADAVYITSPNISHASYSLAALGQKKSVFCEKPFALNSEDATRVAEAAERSGAVFQLGFNRRFAPVYWKMKQLILKGELSPRSFNIKMNRGELQDPPWTSDAKITGGFLFESTLHLIDMVSYLFGEVVEIQAIGSKVNYPCVTDFSLLLRMEGNCHGVFSSCAHASWAFPFERVEIYGDHQTVFNDELEAVTYCPGLQVASLHETFQAVPKELRWGFVEEDRIFVERLKGQKSSNSAFAADHRDGLRNVAIIEQIYDKIHLGR